jgi:Cft2 family RNA processing exonuclease
VTATLTAISGCGAKGPACFLVETGEARLLLDLGYGPQPGLWPDVSNIGAVDALLLSHGHADHAGGLERLAAVGDPPVYATDIVRRTLPSDVRSRSLPLRGETEIGSVRVVTGRSGHAPGGVWLHLSVGAGLLYMGDCSVESTVYAYDPPPPARTLIVDASYGAYDTALPDCLGAFDRVFDVGAVLLPVPPAGRGPEIALHLFRARRILPRIDDAMRASLHVLHGESLACLEPGVENDLATIARDAPSIGRAEGIMLAARADAASGSAATLIERWERDTSPAIVFTGYLPPGTPAERLTQSGRARYMRWNVHPRVSDNARLVRQTGARNVLPAFGDARHLNAWQTAWHPARVLLEGVVAL